MKQQIAISEYQVADVAHMRELIIQDDIREFIPRDKRHQLFWKIKHPYQTFKGPWGNELLCWDGDNPAFVTTTESRSHEIRQHISDLLFG